MLHFATHQIDASHGPIRNLTLRDGRILGYAEFGAPAGKPVLYCHGFPASRIEARLCAPVAQRLGVRLIAPDRPGMGTSGFQRDRRIRNWPEDAAALADELGLDRFGVIGVSGGAPYALACAASLGKRVTHVGLVCGVAEMHESASTRQMGRSARAMLELARRAPAFSRWLYGSVVGHAFEHWPGLALRVLTSAAPAADRSVLAQNEVRDLLVSSSREAFRQGPLGPAWELGLLVRPWQLELEAIRAPVSLWHGEADRTVPPDMGHSHAHQLRLRRAEFLRNEGHFSLPINHMQAIFESIL